MQKKAGRLVVGLCMVAVGLAGCAAQHHSAESSVATASRSSNFSVQTPIDQIAADKNGKDVLERDVPGVMNNPHYILYSCMSLAQVASLSGGRLTKAKLDRVDEDLAGLSAPCVQ